MRGGGGRKCECESGRMAQIRNEFFSSQDAHFLVELDDGVVLEGHGGDG